MLLRLGEKEFVALAGGPDYPAVPARLPSFVTGGDDSPGLCPVPRDATSAWFSLAGDAAADMLATVCPVDLRAKAFSDYEVAQTLVGQVSAIVTRDRMPTLDRFHILVDWSTAHHLWSVCPMPQPTSSREADMKGSGWKVPHHSAGQGGTTAVDTNVISTPRRMP